MTSPSMKSAEKKTPEKKRSSSESDIAPDTADQETPRLRFDLNAFAWMRVFRFSNLLVRQG